MNQISGEQSLPVEESAFEESSHWLDKYKRPLSATAAVLQTATGLINGAIADGYNANTVNPDYAHNAKYLAAVNIVAAFCFTMVAIGPSETGERVETEGNHSGQLALAQGIGLEG